MGETTGIEWTDATWNPWHGCHKVSQGCRFCYMFREKKRYGQDPDRVMRSKTTFGDPLKWKEARRVFTCSWSDFMIEEADPWRDEAWDIMRRTPQHTYQVLTKRIERAAGRVPDPPLPNVWLGVSVEDQKTADERIPLLLKTPAAIRFVSYEPALGPVDLESINITVAPGFFGNPLGWDHRGECHKRDGIEYPIINWVIAGGESGPVARPINPDWIRLVRNQCVAAHVPFFFKQWGEYAPLSGPNSPYGQQIMRVGKKAAGAMLDGREWKQFPEVEV